MSTEGPVVQKDTIHGACPRCGQEMTYHYPIVDIINGEQSSAMIACHRENRCPKCQLKFRTIIQGVQGTRFQWLPIPDSDVMLGEEAKEKEPKIIIAQNVPKGLVRPN